MPCVKAMAQSFECRSLQQASCHNNVNYFISNEKSSETIEIHCLENENTNNKEQVDSDNEMYKYKEEDLNDYKEKEINEGNVNSDEQENKGAHNEEIDNSFGESSLR